MPNVWLFSLAVLALIASPGPDFFYVLGRGVAQGPRAGALSALGISLGLCGHTLLAVLGLSAALAASPWLFLVVKMAGAAYLLWMGIKILIAARASIVTDDSIAGDSPSVPAQVLGPDAWAIVRRALLTNLFNPKAALTFLAFLPQWVRAPSQHGAGVQASQAWSVPAQFALLGAVTVGLALAWFCLVGLAAGRVGALLRRHPGAQRASDRATGVLLIVLGVALALQQR